MRIRKEIMADSFTNMYPVSKTLRFELRPIRKTLEYIERKGILDTDKELAEKYKKAKKIIDEYHKSFIERALSNIALEGLEEYNVLYNIQKRNSDESKQFEEIQVKLRKQISKKMKETEGFSNLFNKELIREDIIKFIKEEDKREIIESFYDFTTYFTGYNENRANMYKEDVDNTSIANRLITENLPKYCDNIKLFDFIKDESVSECFSKMEKDFKPLLGVMSIKDYFTLDGFNLVSTQHGIEIYNALIGGYSDRDKKIQGINEYINLYNQKNKTNLPIMKQLYKQILSDTGSYSFIEESFEDDSELINAVGDIAKQLMLLLFDNGNKKNLYNILSGITDYDLNGIYIKNDNTIASISNDITGDWSVIKSAIIENYDRTSEGSKKNLEKYEENRSKALAKVDCYSIAELNSYCDGLRVEDYFISKIEEKKNIVTLAYDRYMSFDWSKVIESNNLKRDKDAIAVMKELLDAYKDIQWMIKPLTAGNAMSQKDETFYGSFTMLWDELEVITPLYNKVRNYVTRKPYSLEKVKLNFGKSTLFDGWDKNKERDNLGIIFIKDGNYYLGIMDRNDTRIMENAPECKSSSAYRKMEYKLLPGPNKMLPKVFFSKSRMSEFNPSEKLMRNYKAGTHNVGENFILKDCHELIDFFKTSIEKHEDWSQFHFKFSDTKKYKNIGDFYKEVEAQGYQITFKDISEEYINELVDAGKLYLFQIYNKDFSKYSKGTPNLHTMYLKALFDEENLKDVVYKLNGKAEIFYRKASIPKDNTTVHPANQPILNKDPLNSKRESVFTYDLIKNRRFTCDKFQFHVSILMNFKAKEPKNINALTREAIRQSKDLHIIGIDRGERNLLYVSVIDLNGKIVKQLSLNILESFDSDGNLHRRDYQSMLVDKEKENIKSRQNWTTIGSIKEIKEGYLSQAIHTITQLMIEYNAIVVLEDLNFGFKQGRQKFERQVYQKFEKMLIDKLNYMVDKKSGPSEYGGLYKAYQLTNQFESFKTLGKQSGFLFYVPAWNTSKIDPTTGFANLFYAKYESIEKTKAFILKFDSIGFDTETNSYKFSFDYEKFTYRAEGTKTKWDVYSVGDRIDHYRDPDNNSMWTTRRMNLTNEFNKLFEEYNVNTSAKNIIDDIVKISDATYYKKFIKLFNMMVQLRNSDEENGIDNITSPVMNSKGVFFVSGTDDNEPKDADANGAYNIAKKGLMIVEAIRNADESEISKVKLAISNKDWLKFAQERHL